MLFADVHANLPALQAALANAQGLGADSYIFLGDAVGYGPHPSEVIDVLASLPSALLLQGNHDYAVATGDTEGMSAVAADCIRWTESVLSEKERRWLSALRPEHVEGSWMALHGAPIDPVKFNVYITEATCRESLTALQKAQRTTCFFGHTHVPSVHRRTGSADRTIYRPTRERILPDGHQLVNPGSIGQPRDGIPKSGFALWDRESGEVTFHRVPYEIDTTLAALKKAGLHTDLAYRLQLGR